MPKNRKVKGFCNFCGDPVITGGKQYSGKWYHAPCYVAHSYGMPQNVKPGAKPRRSAPPWREIKERSEEGLNPIGVFPGTHTRRREEEPDMAGMVMNPEEKFPELEILAHAHNVTLGMNPLSKGGAQRYFIWEGPRATAQNIVRFPNYPQANQYYRDVIDGKIGVAKNPSSRFRMRPIYIIGGIVLVAALAYWIYRKRATVGGKVKEVAAKMASSPKPLDGFGGSP